ncbi:MAG: hypothetical protein GWN86_23155 [Desulfobacterales bacterium]|nr:hypothetical protein [Desulfobacterales bacterium]
MSTKEPFGIDDFVEMIEDNEFDSSVSEAVMKTVREVRSHKGAKRLLEALDKRESGGFGLGSEAQLRLRDELEHALNKCDAKDKMECTVRALKLACQVQHELAEIREDYSHKMGREDMRSKLPGFLSNLKKDWMAEYRLKDIKSVMDALQEFTLSSWEGRVNVRYEGLQLAIVEMEQICSGSRDHVGHPHKSRLHQVLDKLHQIQDIIDPAADKVEQLEREIARLKANR